MQVQANALNEKYIYMFSRSICKSLDVSYRVDKEAVISNL